MLRTRSVREESDQWAETRHWSLGSIIKHLEILYVTTIYLSFCDLVTFPSIFNDIAQVSGRKTNIWCSGGTSRYKKEPIGDLEQVYTVLDSQ